MRKLGEHAQAASEIRKYLKHVYPSIKFSVKSKSYTGGSSVDVNWVNGPTTEEVDKLIGKYEYGQFDGMQDLYEMTNVRNDIPQVKYVFARREVTQEHYAEIMAQWYPDKKIEELDYNQYRHISNQIMNKSFV